MRGRAVPGAIAPLGGVAAVLLLWQLCAVTVFAGRHVVPTPYAVVALAITDRFYLSDIATTVRVAAAGWLIGNICAGMVAAVCLAFPRLETIALRASSATYAVPTVAIGPVLLVLTSPTVTKVAMAALPVFFTTLVGVLVGLRSAPRAALDMVRAFGANRWDIATKVRPRYAIPATFSGLALAAPAALLGAMVGDYLGGSSGLGVVMLQAQASLNVTRVWAVGACATALSGTVFWLVDRSGRWLRADDASVPLEFEAGRRAGHNTSGRNPAPASLRQLASLAATLTALIGCWWLAIRLLGLDPYLAKTPGDLVAAWNQSTGGASNGDVVLAGLVRTGTDAGLGYLIGTGVAVTIACGLMLSRTLRATLLPVVLVLRSVPLVAMAPLFGLLFGRGVAGVAAISCVIVLVPTVVTVYHAMRSVHPGLRDVFMVGNASPLTVLRRLHLPCAVPALLAAARVAVPGALLGAVVAEWLLTDAGLGHVMAVAVIESNFAQLWSAAAIATFAAVTMYHLASEAEQLTANRFAS